MFQGGLYRWRFGDSLECLVHIYMETFYIRQYLKKREKFVRDFPKMYIANGSEGDDSLLRHLI